MMPTWAKVVLAVIGTILAVKAILLIIYVSLISAAGIASWISAKKHTITRTPVSV